MWKAPLEEILSVVYSSAKAEVTLPSPARSSRGSSQHHISPGLLAPLLTRFKHPPFQLLTSLVAGSSCCLCEREGP